MFLIVVLILFCIVGSLVSVIRVAIYGGSLIKPDFQKALERINENNQIGMILTSSKGFIVLNAIAYYLILLGWIAAIGGIIYWMVK